MSVGRINCSSKSIVTSVWQIGKSRSLSANKELSNPVIPCNELLVALTFVQLLNNLVIAFFKILGGGLLCIVIGGGRYQD